MEFEEVNVLWLEELSHSTLHARLLRYHECLPSHITSLDIFQTFGKPALHGVRARHKIVLKYSTHIYKLRADWLPQPQAGRQNQ